MKKFLSIVRAGAMMFLVAAPIYLANQGELGVNLTTIMSTSSPIVIIIITYTFDLLKYVLPSTMVKLVLSKFTKTLGAENVKFLTDLVNTTTPELLVKQVNEFRSEFNEMKETLALIREDQVSNS
jgi:hypothetical protein